MEQTKKAKNESAILTGVEKWLMVQFCGAAKELHFAIEKNDILTFTRVLYHFWYETIAARKSGK